MEQHLLKYQLAYNERSHFEPPCFFLPSASKLRIQWQPSKHFEDKINLMCISGGNDKGQVLFSIEHACEVVFVAEKSTIYEFSPDHLPEYWDYLGELNFYIDTTEVTEFFTSHTPEVKSGAYSRHSAWNLLDFRYDIGKCVVEPIEELPRGLPIVFDGSKDQFSSEKEYGEFIHVKVKRIYFKAEKGNKIYIEHPKKIFKKFSYVYVLYKVESGEIDSIYDTSYFLANEDAIFYLEVIVKKLHKIKDDFPVEPYHFKLLRSTKSKVNLIQEDVDPAATK